MSEILEFPDLFPPKPGVIALRKPIEARIAQMATPALDPVRRHRHRARAPHHRALRRNAGVWHG